MALVADLVTQVKANTKNFNRNIKRSEKLTKKFAGTIKFMAKGLALAFAGTAVISMKKFATELDNIAKTSDKLGLAPEALQKLQFQAELTGVSVSTMNMGLQRMVRRVAEAAAGTGAAQKALKQLGIDVDTVTKMSADKQFLKIAEAMKEVGSSSEQLRLATKIFDSEAAVVVNTLKSNLQETGQEFDNMGVALSRIELKQIEEMNDRFTKLATKVGGMGKKLFSSFVPFLERIVSKIKDATEAIAALFRKSKEGFKEIGELSRSTSVGSKAIDFTSGIFDRLAFLSRVVRAGTLDPRAVGTAQDSRAGANITAPTLITDQLKNQAKIPRSVIPSIKNLDRVSNEAADSIKKLKAATETTIDGMIASAKRGGIADELDRLIGGDIDKKFSGRNEVNQGFDSTFKAVFDQLTSDPKRNEESIQRMLSGVRLNSVSDVGKVGAVEELREFARSLGIKDKIAPGDRQKLEISVKPAKGFDLELLQSENVKAFITNESKTAVIKEASKGAKQVRG